MTFANLIFLHARPEMVGIRMTRMWITLFVLYSKLIYICVVVLNQQHKLYELQYKIIRPQILW
jgi:hypothetical protein